MKLTCLMFGLLACGNKAAAPVHQQMHSSAMVASADGTTLFVAHPDADVVTFIDTRARSVTHEILLAGKLPAPNPDSQRYDSAAEPRALALDSAGAHLYVTGERSSALYAVDVASARVTANVIVCAEPVGVLVSADDAHLFVACSQDDEIVQLSTVDLSVEATLKVPRKPWALAWSPSGNSLYATHLLGPGVSFISTSPLTLETTWPLADGPSTDDATEPHGPVRGIYDALVRPGSQELWVPHLMLGIDTAQPKLDFLRTVFASVSLFGTGGGALARLVFQANPGDGGAFGDSFSGPHAIAFSDDGKFAFVVNQNSEDVVAIDTTKRVEATLLRPLPGHMPESVVVQGNVLYVYERGSEDVAQFAIKETATGVSIVADGDAFAALTTDPMPAELRLGQKLFYSANSDDVPTTQNHWVACASCHIEGRSDAVTWKFAQGPRDTPSNAGGTRDTGFLFRTADRNQVQDYWKTINVEQGGHFSLDSPAQKPLLDALADFVNDAIPTPTPPQTNPTLVARGQALFEDPAVGCSSCHSGPAHTDSGSGNPGLLMEGTVLLHDVGTCNTGDYPDVAHADKDGNPRTACDFDTPALRGLWDSAPYFHDGSAATLGDVLTQTRGTMGDISGLTSDDLLALVEYLKSL